jgi:hypothetical protein
LTFISSWPESFDPPKSRFCWVRQGKNMKKIPISRCCLCMLTLSTTCQLPCSRITEWRDVSYEASATDRRWHLTARFLFASDVQKRGPVALW